MTEIIAHSILKNVEMINPIKLKRALSSDITIDPIRSGDRIINAIHITGTAMKTRQHEQPMEEDDVLLEEDHEYSAFFSLFVL